MPALESLSAPDVAGVVRAYHDALKLHMEAINRLNVYPVPDGDTGTNMWMTVEAVSAEIEGIGPVGALGMEAVTKCMAHGSLMGARGNSGVILSQVMRGIAGAFSDAGEAVAGAEMADALLRAADSAYAAVSNPVEGTILSVARAAAKGAGTAVAGPPAPGRAPDGPSLVVVLEAARAAAADALAKTTEQLAALRSAGVVDAGGAGFLLMLDSFLQVVDGRAPEEPPGAPGQPLAVAEPGQTGKRGGADGARQDGAGGDGKRGGADGARQDGARQEGAGEEGVGQEGVGDLRYEVMFLLHAPDESVPGFRSVWATCGGSVVIVGGDGLYNCHIHTDDIGASIEAAIEIGRPRQIRVTDLHEQVEEERWVREAEASGSQGQPPAEPCNCAVVAVCAGEGVRRIFASLGARQTVAGGQAANPSTAQLLEAIEAAPAEQVIVLPNNPNVIAVAQQAADHSHKKVRVVPTPGVPEGFAAMLDYDPEADVDSNVDNMTAAAQRVVAGEVAQASRQAATDAGAVQPGDWLGLSRRGVTVVAPAPSTPADAAIALLDALVNDDHEIVTVIEGDGAGAADTRRIEQWLSERHPAVGVEVHHGGQPLYPYLFSIE